MVIYMFKHLSKSVAYVYRSKVPFSVSAAVWFVLIRLVGEPPAS